MLKKEMLFLGNAGKYKFTLKVGSGVVPEYKKSHSYGYLHRNENTDPKYFGTLSPTTLEGKTIVAVITRTLYQTDYYTAVVLSGGTKLDYDSLTIKRLDTGASLKLNWDNGASAKEYVASKAFFNSSDENKEIPLEIWGGLSYGYLRKIILVMLRISSRGARHDLAQAPYDGRRLRPEAQGHHLHKPSRRRLVRHERQTHVRSSGRLTKDELIHRRVRTVAGLLGHSGCRSTDQSGDRYETRLLRRGNVERHGRVGNIGLGQLLSAHGELQHVPALGVRDHHFGRCSFRLAANCSAFAKEAA